MDKERLGKIVRLAKNGEGGEKENALRLVKKICEENGLDFNAVMSDDEEEKERVIPYRNETEKSLICQIIGRYGSRSIDHQVWTTNVTKTVHFKATKEMFVETLNAVSVLLPLYKKELAKLQQAMFMGFLDKHDLYYKPRLDEMEAYMNRVNKQRSEATDADKKSARLGAKLAEDMETAHIRKQIE